jgi:hypothetical protein
MCAFELLFIEKSTSESIMQIIHTIYFILRKYLIEFDLYINN